MKTVIINHKRYTVEHVFNMVGNYEFTDKDGVIHLVDGEDVAVKYGTSTLDNAIKYARYWAEELEDGVFWWKTKEVTA